MFFSSTIIKCDIVEYFFNNEQSERNTRFLVEIIIYDLWNY